MRIVTTMTLTATVLTKVAQWLAAAHESVAQLSPIHLLVVALLIVMATAYLALGPKTVYLVD